MPAAGFQLKTEFAFGSSQVRIVEGDILRPPTGVTDAALVCSDDNYLTMHSGVSFALRSRLGKKYVHDVQAKCPVEAGTVIFTQLPKRYNRKDEITEKLDSRIKYIFHMAAIDYDRHDRDLETIVEHAVANCLSRAEELGLKSVLLPAIGGGSGGEDPMRKSARSLCSAIKRYLAEERPVKQVVIVLHRPAGQALGVNPERDARLNAFKQEANLILDIPYNPLLPGRQSRHLYNRSDLLERLVKLLNEETPVKKHALLTGGPKSGKWSLLDQLYLNSQADPASFKGCFLSKVTFSNFNENTSLSFIYRKLLIAMARYEHNQQIRQKILEKYANPTVDFDSFLSFLNEHYEKVVFLVDELPDLPEILPYEVLQADDARRFWTDLEPLQAKVNFFFTIRGEQQYTEFIKRLQQYAPSFQSQIEVIWVPCVSEEQRSAWVQEIYHRWIEENEDIPYQVQDFFNESAGYHAYLISLASFFLVQVIQQERVSNRDEPFNPRDRILMDKLIDKASRAIDEHRRKFFASMLDLDRIEKLNLLYLAKATAQEQEAALLIPGVLTGNQRAENRLGQLQSEGNLRDQLDDRVMENLELRGYIVRAKDNSWQFMCRPFAAFVLEHLAGVSSLEDRPSDVVISLLAGKDLSIRTMFHSRGARILTADKLLSRDLLQEFLDGYYLFARRKKLSNSPDENVFKSPADLGSILLTQFTTSGIKRYLQDPPKTCTVFFIIDESLQVIPWELMLEAAYAGEIPFRVGRSVASLRQAQNLRPPVRGVSHIKALLIGNPTGDLEDAEAEIDYLCRLLLRDRRFDTPDVFMGQQECQRMRILNALSSGRYGLVHYAGHSIAHGPDSAWLAADGPLTTSMLTSAVQMAPPALIFSSSCSSAVSSELAQPSYEDQSFDLPGAFLLAGVETYIGTLWDVDSQASRRFVERFYTDFLLAQYNTGECLRRAKWMLKQAQPKDQNDWLAFILYGDPHTYPQELFPVLRLTGEKPAK